METKNVVISKEYLERIRRYAAIRPEEHFTYTPTVYRDMPEALRPEFVLRPISGEETLKFSDSMRGEVRVEGNGKTTVSVKRGEFTINVVRRGLVGWKNYYDERGNVVEFSGVIDNLPVALMEELCEAIVSRASLSNDEVLGLR